MKIPAKDLLDVLNAYAKNIRVPMSRCPNCDEPNDYAGAVDGSDAKPRPGDASICWRCGHLCVFDEDLRLKNPSDAQITAIAGDRRIVKAQSARAFARRMIDAIKPKSTKF